MKFTTLKILRPAWGDYLAALLLMLPSQSVRAEEWKKEMERLETLARVPVHSQAEVNRLVGQFEAFLKKHGSHLEEDDQGFFMAELENNPNIGFEDDEGFIYLRDDPGAASKVVPIQIVASSEDPIVLFHLDAIKNIVAKDQRFRITDETEILRLVLTVDVEKSGDTSVLEGDLTLNPGSYPLGIWMESASVALSPANPNRPQITHMELLGELLDKSGIARRFLSVRSSSTKGDFNDIAGCVLTERRINGGVDAAKRTKGIGVLLDASAASGYPMVKEVSADSPAERAGIPAGAILISVGTHSLKGYSALEAKDFIAKQPDIFEVRYADGIEKLDSPKVVRLQKAAVEHSQR